MILPDPEQFKYKDCVIAGDECWLITPRDMATSWTDDNARFRSCIVRKDGYIVSQGFCKFVNFFEKPDFQPWNKEWKVRGTMKIDGSLLIISKHKNELIVRTRRTTDARQLANGHEIDFLIRKYPRVFDNDLVRSECCSILCEWTTPTNVVCIREHDEPTLTLVGIVEYNDPNSEDGKWWYWTQEWCDDRAKEWGVPRPKKYEYNSIEECILDVDAWKGKEGVVVCSPDGQTLKKIKAAEYLSLHAICTGIKNINHVLDLFMTTDKFHCYDDFYHYVETTINYELAEKIKDDMVRITNAYVEYLKNVEQVRRSVDNIRGESFTRKDQALEIVRRYDDWRKPAAFQLLDNREVDDKIIRKAIESYL